MAEKKATLIVEIKDLATKAIGVLRNALSSLASSVLGVTISIGGLVSGMFAAINAYAQQEKATEKLSNALKNQGITSKAVLNDLSNFASELQRTTTVGDETSLEMLGLLTTFGLTGDVLKNVYKSAIDLSRGLGIDLHTATLMLGKAAVGETGTLGRYGIVIDESIPKAQKLAEVLRQVNERFGGAAASELNTYAGKVLLLKNTFGEVGETIGKVLMPAAELYTSWLQKFLNWAAGSAAANNELTVSQQALKKVTLELAEAHRILGSVRQLQGVKESIIQDAEQRVAILTRERDEIVKNIQAEKDLQDVKITKAVMPNDELTKLQETAAERIQSYQFESDEIKRIKDEELAYKLQKLGDYETASALLEQTYNDANVSYGAQTVNKQKALDDQQFQMKTQFFGNLSKLSKAKSKEIAAIGKAAGIAHAYMSTYQAAAGALAMQPVGPWNFALAASFIAAGLADVAQIAGVELAQGGMVMPTNGGTSAIIGEAGKAEAVIPLEDPATQEKLAGVMGGNTIVIQAGTIVADDYSLDKFARKIDEKLFELGRNKQSYSR